MLNFELMRSACCRGVYETNCENIVSRYQTLVSSLPREAVFRRRRPKAHFMTGRTGSPVTAFEGEQHRQLDLWSDGHSLF